MKHDFTLLDDSLSLVLGNKGAALAHCVYCMYTIKGNRNDPIFMAIAKVGKAPKMFYCPC